MRKHASLQVDFTSSREHPNIQTFKREIFKIDVQTFHKWGYKICKRNRNRGR